MQHIYAFKHSSCLDCVLRVFNILFKMNEWREWKEKEKWNDDEESRVGG